MKCLLLVPKIYSLDSTISKGFSDNNIETYCIDYQNFFSPYINGFVNRYESLPGKLKNYWKLPYIKKINSEYIKLFESYNPEIVFIYNNQLILPETLEHFQTKSKIIIFLGDNPLYTPSSEYNLLILQHSDIIICPDTFWVEQLQRLGLKHSRFGIFGFNEIVYYPFEPSPEDYKKYASDLVYIGTAQKNNWGFKRFLFLNKFKAMNLKAFISGEGYKLKWKKYFPDLEDKIIEHHNYDQSFNNLVSNCAKIYPIDLVPSLFNGIHLRIMDAIGSGVLPLVEYSKDLDLVFKNILIPVIKNYDDAESIARYYINNDSVRKKVISDLRDFSMHNYSPKKIICETLTDLI